MSNLPILIVGDHRGLKLKSALTGWLQQKGHTVEDLGTHSEDRCDASDFAVTMAERLRSNDKQLGILICGSGHAMAMAANRYRHIRAVHCLNAGLATSGREHNDANVLVLAGDHTDVATAQKITEAFLGAKFLGGKYAERKDKLTDLGGL